MSDEISVRPAGRPKDAAKRQAILAAARALCFAHGATAVTLEAVAAAARVSRMTVYAHFGDKETLFTEVIAAEAAGVARALAALDAGPGELRPALIAFGCDLTRFLQRSEIRAFNALLEAQGPRHPAIARAFVEAGPRAVLHTLAQRLGEAAAAGRLAPLDPPRAAGQLLGLWRAIETSSVRLGLARLPDEVAIADHVTASVEMFLRAYAPLQGGSVAGGAAPG